MPHITNTLRALLLWIIRQAVHHFSTHGKLLQWCQYQAMGQILLQFPPQYRNMSDASIFMLWLQWINSATKGWGLQGVHNPHFTCLGSHSASEINPCEISRLISKDCSSMVCPSRNGQHHLGSLRSLHSWFIVKRISCSPWSSSSSDPSNRIQCLRLCRRSALITSPGSF